MIGGEAGVAPVTACAFHELAIFRYRVTSRPVSGTPCNFAIAAVAGQDLCLHMAGELTKKGSQSLRPLFLTASLCTLATVHGI